MRNQYLFLLIDEILDHLSDTQVFIMNDGKKRLLLLLNQEDDKCKTVF